MGQSSSNFTKKMNSWWGKGADQSTSSNPDLMAVTPFVFTRTSSMYFDEDGDLAHEFYEEVLVDSKGRTIMRRRRRNLTPQGEVKLQIPRLHVDFPVVICEAPLR